MTDEPTNLVLEQLRFIRKDVADIKADVIDIKGRVSSLEEITGQILVLMGVMSKRQYRADERLSRLERRLDLADA